ncbi:hypothetical protein BYT27DRAFT_7217901, partial [Phlegmacium glaucopus]
MPPATSATTEAAAALSDIPVALGDPVMGAICRLENMTSPSNAIEPVDFLRNDDVSLVNGETGTLVCGSSSELDSIYTTDMTPLETSLLYSLKSSTTMRPELIHSITKDNNPQRVKSEKEKAVYWVQTDGTPLLLSFPAILDTQGKYGCTDPYFNMIENADENNFKRTKALFELKLLKENDPLYPPEVQEVEEKQSTGLTYKQRAAITEFWRAQDVLVVTSDPLFEGMGDPSKIDTPKISRSQISSRAVSLLPGTYRWWFLNMTPLSSPSKAPPSRSSSGSTGLAKLALQAMPDLYGHYANLMARHPHLESMTVIPPNIHDQNGAIILPSDYLMKLGNQTPVFIMVKLRLWESSPQSEEKRATSGFKSREGEENGSRIYQLDL